MPDSVAYTKGSPALIDAIHGAIVGETEWRDVLDETRGLLPNGQALLFHHDISRGAGAFAVVAGGDDSMVDQYRTYYSTVNPWMDHASVRPLGRFVQADDMLPRDELHKTEYYNDYLKKIGIETGFGVTLARNAGVNFLFSVVCADISEQSAAATKKVLQDLVPHLKLAFDHYRTAPSGTGPAEADVGPIAGPARGIVRVGPGLLVQSVNERAIELTRGCKDLTIGAFSRLQTSSSELLECIASELEAWAAHRGTPSLKIFHIRRQTGALPLRVSVFRPGGISAAFFRGPECILLIDDPDDGLVTAAREFARLYRLSAVEAEIAGDLAKGLDLAAIAQRRGRSVETIRSQVKDIQAKTGLNRQSEIIRHIAVMASVSSE